MFCFVGWSCRQDSASVLIYISPKTVGITSISIFRPIHSLAKAWACEEPKARKAEGERKEKRKKKGPVKCNLLLIKWTFVFASEMLSLLSCIALYIIVCHFLYKMILLYFLVAVVCCTLAKNYFLFSIIISKKTKNRAKKLLSYTQIFKRVGCCLIKCY